MKKLLSILFAIALAFLFVLPVSAEGATVNRYTNETTGNSAVVNYENPPTDEQIVAKCPAKCMSVDPHFESGN